MRSQGDEKALTFKPFYRRALLRAKNIAKKTNFGMMRTRNGAILWAISTHFFISISHDKNLSLCCPADSKFAILGGAIINKVLLQY